MYNKNIILNNIENKNKINDIILLDIIDSTNNYSKRLNIDDDKYSLVIANKQTNGKGRLGRDFYSCSNSSIYLSIVYKPNSFDFISITSIVAVAVCKAIEDITNLKIGIKWVNDLYLNNKKFCGILTEAITGYDNNIERIIIGIGINIGNIIFPDEIKEIATSLTIDPSLRNIIIASILNNIDYFLNNSSQYIDFYLSHSIVLNKDIYFIEKGIKKTGKVIGINNNCELIVEDSNKYVHILRTGDITIRINEANK